MAAAVRGGVRRGQRGHEPLRLRGGQAGPDQRRHRLLLHLAHLHHRLQRLYPTVSRCSIATDL